MKPLFVAALSIGLAARSADFQNLTFDTPDLSGSLRPIYFQLPNGPFQGEANRLLQGWTLTANGRVVSTASYSPNGQTVGNTEFVNLIEVPQDQWGGIEGRIYLSIFSQVNSSQGFTTPPELRLSQTATVPEWVGGLHIYSPGLRDVRINGEPVTDPRLGFLADPVIDISTYAGRQTTFEFVFGPGWIGRLDILGFTAVPEPSNWALSGIGSACLAWALRARRKPRSGPSNR